MGLLPEYHAVLTCDLPVEQVNHRLSVMPLSVSGAAYEKKERLDADNCFTFRRRISRSYPMRKKEAAHPNSFLPKVHITTIPGAEQTEVRLLFQLEDIAALGMIIPCGMTLMVELILIPLFCLTQTKFSDLFPLFLLPVAVLLFLLLGASVMKKGAECLLKQIAYDLSVYHVPELKKGCSFEQ